MDGRLLLIQIILCIDYAKSVDSPNEVLMKKNPKYDSYQDVTMDCKASAQDNSKSFVFKWKFNNNDIDASNQKKYVVGKNFLTIHNPNETDCGDYICQSPVNPAIQNTISLKAPVIVLPINELGSVSLVEGDVLKLKCEAKGCPAPGITWYKRGDKGDAQLKASDRISFTKELPNDLVNSTLKINNMGYGDKGVYLCKATNRLSTSNTTVTVRVKDKLAALWPFLGICIEVAILCTIILIYEKRRAKKHAQAEAAKPNTNYSKSPDVVDVSTEDQDLRHRKA